MKTSELVKEMKGIRNEYKRILNRKVCIGQNYILVINEALTLNYKGIPTMDSFPAQFTSETADVACSKCEQIKKVDYISWYRSKIMELNNAIIALTKEVK
jgi:hypothetical protein